MLKKIICIIFVLLLITITPISTIFQFDTNVYALTTFSQDLDSKMFRQLLGYSLIANGIVFSSTAQYRKTEAKIIDFMTLKGGSYKSPKKPDGPDLQTVVKNMLKGVVIWSAVDGIYKDVVAISDLFQELIKSFVDMNYNPGENYLKVDSYHIFNNTSNITYKFPANLPYIYGYTINNDNTLIDEKVLTLTNGKYKGNINGFVDNPLTLHSESPTGWTDYLFIWAENVNVTENEYGVSSFYNCPLNNFKPFLVSPKRLSTGTTNYQLPDPIDSTISSGIGLENVVDNPDYDWQNQQNQKREVGISLFTDALGNPQLDVNGNPIPSTDIIDLIGLTPTDISNQNLTGTVVEDVPIVSPLPIPDLDAETQPATENELDTSTKRALYQKKFPFSLPWDIKAIFTLLRAAPVAPKWEIDIIPTSLKTKIGIKKDTKFVFDMGAKEFQIIPKFTKFFTFISFCLTLIWVTRFIIRS